MPTIESKEIVDEIMAKNGHYYDDPPVQSIVQYTTAWGGTAYGLNYHQIDAYVASEYVRNPKTIFTRKEG